MDNDKINELKELIETFGKEDEEIKSKTKILDSRKNLIKNLMGELNLNEEVSDHFKINYSIQTRTTIDEGAMLEVLLKDWLSNHDTNEICPYIKTKQYIDMDELENALFNNQLDITTIQNLDKCKADKEVQVLKVTRKKGA